MANLEIVKATGKSKCRLCDQQIEEGTDCAVFRRIHVSPKIVDLFFHVKCFCKNVIAAFGEIK